MKNFTMALQDRLQTGAIGYVATMFKIILTDGTVLAFTTFDQWVSYLGTNYNPDVGVGLTEMDSQSIGTKVSTMKFSGLLGTYVTADDLRYRWSGATLLVFNCTPKQDPVALDWSADTDLDIELLRFGDIGNLKLPGDGTFTGEFRSISQRASVSFGVACNPLCPYRFGVNKGLSRCPVDLATKRHTVSLASVSSDGLTLTFTLATTDDYLTNGTIEALDGANAGIPGLNIKKHTQSGTTATVELYDRFPLTLLVSASMRVTEGCQRRFDPDCLRHTGDGAPHGGFKDLVGPDFQSLRVK
jgi:hypothetical protein